MANLASLGIFVGTGDCNANCVHCAGKPLRKCAPKQDGIIDSDLIYRTLKNCYEQGARSLSISSSGEPTLSPISVTKTLELINEMKKENVEYNWINLYSNGIRIGEDREFSDKYLPLWHNLGLKTVYITVHNLDEGKNAEVYGIKRYPSLREVVSRIHRAELLTRANIVLTKNNAKTFESYVSMIQGLRAIGFNHISAWPIRNSEDKPDLKLAPLEEEITKMVDWAKEHETSDCRLRVLGESSRISYQTGQKLTLFPDGSLSSSWCN